MVTAATLGEVLDRAEEHLRAAGRCPVSLLESMDAMVELRRLMTVMGHYLADRTPAHMPPAVGWAGKTGPGQAVIDARDAISQAAAGLPAGHSRASQLRPPAGLAGELGRAATALAAGRDLLHTHLATSPDGQWLDRSPWAPVIRSPAVTTAVATQVMRWAGQAERIAARLAAACPPGSAAEQGLQGATPWLKLAGLVLQPTQPPGPDAAAGKRLLRAIPTARLPRRRLPSSGEPATGLPAEITLSAERLRAAVFATHDHPAPVNADACRWIATASAITTQASQHLLHTHTHHPTHAQHLAAAAAALDQASQAWRQAAISWLPIATAARGTTSPATNDLTDLMLRLGRLAWNDPGWSPTSPPNSYRRPAEDSQLTTTLAATHQATDALATLGIDTLAAITLAAHTRQLHVLTRTLPDGYDIPRRYAPALTQHTRPLLHAYQHAQQATIHAAQRLAVIAVALDAPSAPLALARAACAPPPSGSTKRQPDPGPSIASGHQPAPAAAYPASAEADYEPSASQRPTAPQPALAPGASHAATHTRDAPRQPDRAAQLAAQDLPGPGTPRTPIVRTSTPAGRGPSVAHRTTAVRPRAQRRSPRP